MTKGYRDKTDAELTFEAIATGGPAPGIEATRRLRERLIAFS
jgi:hypothetical protein